MAGNGRSATACDSAEMAAFCCSVSGAFFSQAYAKLYPLETAPDLGRVAGVVAMDVVGGPRVKAERSPEEEEGLSASGCKGLMRTGRPLDGGGEGGLAVRMKPASGVEELGRTGGGEGVRCRSPSGEDAP